MKYTFYFRLGLVLCHAGILMSIPALLFAQKPVGSVYGIPVSPQQAEGFPIRSVVILQDRDGRTLLSDSLETDAFYQAFGIRPGAVFQEKMADLAIRRIEREPDIKTAQYQLYNAEFSGPVTMVVTISFLQSGDTKPVAGIKGMTASKSLRGFPVIRETDRTKILFIINGGIGAYHEENAFFSKGPEFTQGNPIATNPAVKGSRFWGELNLEPGIAGMTKLGNTPLYPYAAISYMITGRNTTDIYTNGGSVYGAIERLYAGIAIPSIGKRKDISINASAGRQFFQLNDGFLISRYSGSANAGERASVYLNARTTFQMSGLLKIQVRKWTIDGFFLEPQELFKDRQTNTRYLGGTVAYNNNKALDAGLTYLTVPHSGGAYSTPQGRIGKKGMWLLNPKLWLSGLGGTGFFLKSEYVYQAHTDADMRSNAWYLGMGYKAKEWRFKPSVYYRYAYMQGDDSNTHRFERFDPVLTGGLGNWVQGINMRKIVGNGNIISHRVEVKANLSSTFEVSLDYFLLMANSHANNGGLPPLSPTLKARNYGQEITLTSRYFLNSHFMLLGVCSWATPGAAVEQAFDTPVYNWLSLQASLFMFF